jgi:hypothetical protein
MSDFERAVSDARRGHRMHEWEGVAVRLAAAAEREAARLTEIIEQARAALMQGGQTDRIRWQAAVQVLAANHALVTREPNYQYQVFDTKRSRVVMEVPTEDVDDVKTHMEFNHWVLRRRVVGPWEEVK